MPIPFQLVTERLILRPWREADRAPFAAMNVDPIVMRFFAAPLTREESDEAIDRYTAQFARDGFSMLALQTAQRVTSLACLGCRQ